jgi:UDP-N-acetyl-D-mannosaminuronic acid dehydrogenase
MKAGEYISKRLMPGNLIIVESTIPVGTTEKLAQFIEEASGLKFGLNFYIAHCPERGLPGKIFKELIENDRVIGGLCSKSTELAYYFYSKFVKGFLHITDDKSAEMVKLVENSSRDVQIAFANQIASICSVVGVDPYDVIELANKHPRVNVLSPTCGVGGHCISVDPQFLIEGFPKNSKLLKIAREINNQKPYQVIERLLTKIDELKDTGLERPKVLGLGVAFKPNVDDLRESPALKITQELMRKSDLFEFVTYDSYAKKEDLEKLEIPYATDLREAIKNADVILVLVRHKEFLLLPEAVFCEKIILDTCGLLHSIEKIKSDNLLTGKHGSTCTFENISF